MSRWKRYLIWIALVLLAFLLIGWSRGDIPIVIKENVHKVELQSAEKKVLFAWQKTVYKEMIALEVTNYLEDKDVQVDVVELEKLNKTMLQEYDAIIIMHSWEVWRPPRVVRRFVKSTENSKKIFMVSTSGGGDLILKNVDGITSASDINNAQNDIDETIFWLNKILSLETATNY